MSVDLLSLLQSALGLTARQGGAAPVTQNAQPSASFDSFLTVEPSAGAYAKTTPKPVAETVTETGVTQPAATGAKPIAVPVATPAAPAPMAVFDELELKPSAKPAPSIQAEPALMVAAMPDQAVVVAPPAPETPGQETPAQETPAQDAPVQVTEAKATQVPQTSRPVAAETRALQAETPEAELGLPVVERASPRPTALALPKAEAPATAADATGVNLVTQPETSAVVQPALAQTMPAQTTPTQPIPAQPAVPVVQKSPEVAMASDVRVTARAAASALPMPTPMPSAAPVAEGLPQDASLPVAARQSAPLTPAPLTPASAPVVAPSSAAPVQPPAVSVQAPSVPPMALQVVATSARPVATEAAATATEPSLGTTIAQAPTKGPTKASGFSLRPSVVSTPVPSITRLATATSAAPSPVVADAHMSEDSPEACGQEIRAPEKVTQEKGVQENAVPEKITQEKTREAAPVPLSPSTPQPIAAPVAPVVQADASVAPATQPVLHSAPSDLPAAPPSSAMAQVAVEGLAALSISVAKRLNDGSTRFAIELHPADFGKVDVSLTIGKDGKVFAHLSFDTAVTQAAFHARESELRQQLAQAGLEVAGDALTFGHRDAADPAPSQSSSQANSQPNAHGAQANPFEQPRDPQGQSRQPVRRGARALADAASAADDTDFDTHLAQLRRRPSRLSLDLSV